MIEEAVLAARRLKRIEIALSQAVCANGCNEPVQGVEIGRLIFITCLGCQRKWIAQTGAVVNPGKRAA